jgi:PilZ domain
MQERRSEVRMLCADLVEVCWKDPQGKARTTSALLEDISVSGACLQTEIPVPVGVSVHWRSPKAEFKGTVRYCEYREIGYFLGVEFDGASKWSRKSFRPQHLLDLKRLIAAARK